MNNKGFTLIELILVISVLSMLALLSTPNIIKLLEKNKADNYNSTIDSIVKATELYISNNRYELVYDDKCLPSDSEKNINTTIKLQNIIDTKDIKTPVTNFCTDEIISSDTIIKITLNCGTKQFKIDIDETTSSNTLKRKNGILGIDGLKIEEDNTCDSLYSEN